MLKNIFKKIFTPLNLIILAALFVRIFNAYKLGDFSWDEMFSITFSQKPWGDSLGYWLIETNPPLHMLFLKLYWYLWPSAAFLSRHLEVIARAPSIIMGTISVYLIYKVAYKNFNKNTALIAATLLSFNILHIMLSATARGYTLLMLLEILSLDYFYDYFIKEIKQKNTVKKLVLVSCLALFTHITAFILIVSELTCLLVLNKEKTKEYFLKHLPFFLPIGLWYIVSIFAKMPMNDLGRAWFFNLQPGFQYLFILSSFMIMPLKSYYLSILVFLFVLFGIIWQIKIAKDKIHHFKQYGVLILVWLITVLFIISVRLYNEKFYFIALSAFIILLADLLDKLPIKKWWLPIILLFMLANNTYDFLSRYNGQNWQKVITQINEKNTDKKTTVLIISDTDEILTAQRYLHPDFKFLVYNADKYTEKTMSIKLIRENYIFLKSPEQEIDAWLSKNIDGQFKEVFILEGPSKPIGLLDQMKNHGYTLKVKMDKAIIEGDQATYWYEKN